MDLSKLDLSNSKLAQKIADSNAAKNAGKRIMKTAQNINNNPKGPVTDTFKFSLKVGTEVPRTLFSFFIEQAAKLIKK